MRASERAISEKIERARELLKTMRHAAMATVNEDGSPHNSPVMFQIDAELRYLYWASNPAAQHSHNLARTGQLFAVLYESESGNGLYLQARGAHELSGEELEAGLKERNKQRAEDGKPPIGIEHYSGTTPQRMYRAEITHFWTNESEKDTAGNIINDYRVAISREDLV